MQDPKTEILQNFSVRLKGLMSKEKLSLQDIVDHLTQKGFYLSASTVSAWRQAKNFPSHDIVPGLAELLGTTPQFLIYGITEDPQNTATEDGNSATNVQEPPANVYRTKRKGPNRSLVPHSDGWDFDPMQINQAFRNPDRPQADTDYVNLSKEWFLTWVATAKDCGASDSAIYSELRRKLTLKDFHHLSDEMLDQNQK